MRFLADAGVSPRTVEFLAQLGHHRTRSRAGAQPSGGRSRSSRGSLIATFDLGFGDIPALGVLGKPSVIILRLSHERATLVGRTTPHGIALTQLVAISISSAERP